MNKKNVVPEARKGLNRFKMEAANEVGVNLKQGYNGDQMVNIMTPTRTLHFQRKSRIKRGHRVTIEYAFSLAV